MLSKNTTIFIVFSIALISALGLAFRDALYDIHQLWLNVNDGYSHGYLVLAICLYLLYSDREKLVHIHLQPSGLCFTLFFLSLIGVLSADFIGVKALIIPALVPCLLFGLGAIGGTQLTRLLAPSILFIYFALPIWDLLLPVLQGITVTISKAVLQELGITALYQGPLVRLPYGDVLIEESCSGLRYLTIALTLSSLYFVLNFKSDKLKGLMIVLLAIALAMIANWIRVTYIIYVAYETNMQHPYVEDHYNFGWVVFSIAMIPFFLIARYLQPVPETGDNKEVNVVNAQSLTASTMKTCIFACSAILLIPVLNHYFLSKQSSPGELPHNTQTVAAQKIIWDAQIFNYDKFDVLRSEQKNGKRTELRRYAFITQRQGKEMIDYKNTVVNFSDRGLVELGKSEYKLPTRNGTIKINYWYQVAGIDTRNKYAAKLLELLNLIQVKQASSIFVEIEQDAG